MDINKVTRFKINDDFIVRPHLFLYLPPEVWREETYSYKFDLWSIGCIIYELCNLKPPFTGNNPNQLYKNICKGQPERISNIYSDDLWKFIQNLLKVDIQERCD